jgi:hypothetical protein
MSNALSRTAIEQHLRCPLCFFLQRKLGVRPPAMIPLTLAVATDALLKNEFDAIRETGASHPLWQREGLRFRAFDHPDIDAWRNNRRGIRVVHASGVEVYGAVDDVWQDRDTGVLHIVDYKSTSKKDEPSLEGGFGDGYKRQIEIYQWLFREAGYPVSSTGYFLYVNGSKQGTFYPNGNTEGVMRFASTLIPYEGTSDWVDNAISDAVNCLKQDVLPASGGDCDSCRYFSERAAV